MIEILKFNNNNFIYTFFSLNILNFGKAISRRQWSCTFLI